MVFKIARNVVPKSLTGPKNAFGASKDGWGRLMKTKTTRKGKRK